ncbi:MAG: bifunctional phosphoglucose/phosphomannose isomerase [Candidatus Rokuibacteriota bacterium]|nr:MAG: bifunctional phosphoglucose/phosphomannose isomerase [Candidatus Rokubacteria bacterium]
MKDLDDLAAIRTIDVHDTREVLAAFPLQCRDALAPRADRPLTGRRPRVIVIAGMGGSAAAGDLVAACAADRVDVPVVVHRSYGLPAVATPEALLIAMSYSGDTAEVLSALTTALEWRVPALAVTAGGELARLAEERRIPRVIVRGGLMPRMAVGHLLGDAEIAEALDEISALAAELGPERPTAVNEAKRLAAAIGDRLPAIYAGPETGAAAYRWKTDIEENAKTFAVSGVLPEMNHNEIEAWRRPVAGGLHLIFLRDHDEAPEIARRFAVLTGLIGGSAGGISTSWTRGKSRIARLLSLIYLGQWTSYYLALLYDVDPWSVPLLEELKRRLGAPAP